MSKVEINNQIILLRKNAEQARVHVIKKLTRNAFKYRNKKGTDAQKAKNQRKAGRIVKEILSIKRVKKDDLTKFALRNTLSLKEILESKKSKPVKRIKARIAHHKKFSEKIAEFKAKYPNFMEYLELDTKNQSKSKMTKLKNNEGSENGDSKTNIKRENGSQSSDIEDSEESDNASIEDSDVGSEEQNESEIKTEEINKKKKEEFDIEKTKNLEVNLQCKSENEEEQEDNNLLCIKSTKNKNSENHLKIKFDQNNTRKKLLLNKRKCSEVNSDCESEEDFEETVVIAKNTKKKITAKTKKSKLEKDSEQNTEESFIKPKILKKKNNETKIISKEAIVKKFTDILEEKDSNEDKQQESNIDFKVSNKKIEKEVDPFFLTGNGEGNYLSVALPKRTSCNNDDSDDDNYSNKFNKRKFSQQQNNKFFSKIPDNNSQRFNSNSNKPNQRWQGSERNERFFHRDGPNNKSNFKNVKNGNRDQKPFNKHSNDGSREKKSFESKSKEILHPSWEAKKKQQEILQKGFQGKKVVFGDDI